MVPEAVPVVPLVPEGPAVAVSQPAPVPGVAVTVKVTPEGTEATVTVCAAGASRRPTG